MERPLESLPDDTENLKALLLERQQELAPKADALARSVHELEVFKRKTAWFEDQLRSARHKRKGASSEQHQPQDKLFNEAEALVEEEEIAYRGPKGEPGRRPLPSEPPRREVRHDLSEAERVCACCGEALQCIGKERSEKLKIIPAKAQVVVHVRPKYACRRWKDGFKRASLPLIPSSIATAGLLPWVVTGKFLDRMPLYHLEEVFERLRVDVSLTTGAARMIRAAELLTPLSRALHGALLRIDILQVDDTTVQVLKEPGTSTPSKSYLWDYRAGTGPPVTLSEHQPSRDAEHPRLFLYGIGFDRISPNPCSRISRRDIRPFGMGRRNWNFCATPQEPRASAVLYSIVQTAKAKGLEPCPYLDHLFEQLPPLRQRTPSRRCCLGVTPGLKPSAPVQTIPPMRQRSPSTCHNRARTPILKPTNQGMPLGLMPQST